MAISEGSAGLLPKSADTLPLSAPAFHGLAADATTNPALWAQRSMAAGDGLNYRYVVASGLYLKNGSTADAGVNANGIASGRGLAATLFGATGTTPLMPDPAALSDALGNPTTTRLGAHLLAWDGTQWVRVVPARADATTLTTGTPAAGLYVQASSGAGWLPVRRLSDFGDGNTGTTALPVGPALFNGTTWDVQRGNTEVTLLADAARTASTSSAVQTNRNARGVLVSLRVNAASGTGGLTLKIIAQEPIGGFSYVLLAAPAAITATGTYAYELYPGSSTAGTAGAALVNQRVAGVLPRTWFVQVVHGDASSYTYNVAAATVV